MCCNESDIDLLERLGDFQPEQYIIPRSLAMYSASITQADNELMRAAIKLALNNGISDQQLYEIVLQSYLFLGFPRMLIAADCLSDYTGNQRKPELPLKVSAEEAGNWSKRGVKLCKKVYDSNYERLKTRVENMAPDVFRWMVFEGYGKVLSRPELDIIDRELSIVAFLMMENMPIQLYSHLRGALNVGASGELLKKVVSDIGPAAGKGYDSACRILKDVGVS